MKYCLTSNRSYYQSIHVSDNNRRFPGYGAIDFLSVLACLKETGYAGGMAIEGNPCRSLAESIVYSAGHLSRLSERIAAM